MILLKNNYWKSKELIIISNLYHKLSHRHDVQVLQHSVSHHGWSYVLKSSWFSSETRSQEDCCWSACHIRNSHIQVLWPFTPIIEKNWVFWYLPSRCLHACRRLPSWFPSLGKNKIQTETNVNDDSNQQMGHFHFNRLFSYALVTPRYFLLPSNSQSLRTYWLLENII